MSDMHIHKEEHFLKNTLSTRELFRLLQDAAGAHCEEIGLGAAVTGPKGLMWVVVRQLIELERWPDKGETLCLDTWPGSTRHMFYPRFYLLRDAQGHILGRSSAMWTLVDRQTRKMISPQVYGLELEGLVTGDEARMPTAPAKLPTDCAAEYVVAADVLDDNGHMNNTRYYDLAERMFGDAISGKHLCRAATEYVSEAREGDKMSLRWGRDGDRYYIAGTAEEDKVIFRMSLEYR